jgi:phage shock protein E
MLAFLKRLFGPGTDYKALIAKGAVVVDVRTGPEYDRGHIALARNIPVDRIASQAGAFRAKSIVVICCCESGMRSGRAAAILRQAGVEAYNGGGWRSLQQKLL